MTDAPAPPNQQESPWLPPGPPPLIFDTFVGVDTQPSRPGVDDKWMAWCDGFFPFGKNNLRTLPGVGPAIHTETGLTSVWFDFANIGATPYMVVLHNDGSMHWTNTNTGSSSVMAPAGTIQNPGVNNIAITQWGSQFVLIVAKQTNSYFVWDGTTFYTAGQTVPGDGGGVVPTGISGNAIEIYQSRVWVANGATVSFSAPQSFVDFSTSSGGGSFTSTDSFLRVGFSSLKQTNGFLYLIGDSSINYISGVQTSAAVPPVTTFSNQNADPEIGTPWGNTVDVFSRNVVFANPFGAHISYGGAVSKISDAMDGVYNTVPNFGGFIPSAGKAIIFGKKVWMVLLPIIDPVTGQQQNKLLMWNGRESWWTSLQDVNLTFIQHQEIDSVITCYGTDGTSIYPLFQKPSISFIKTVQSKLWDRPSYIIEKTVSRLFGLVNYYSLLGANLDISVDSELGKSSQIYEVGPREMNWTTAGGQPMNWTTANGQPMTWLVSGNLGINLTAPTAVGQQGALAGITLTTHAADLSLVSLTLVDEIWGYRG